MNTLLRPAVLLVALAPLAVGALGLSCSLGPADFREARRAEELQRLHRASFRRLQSRREVVQEVIAGRCSLAEALALFRKLEREWPDYATPASQRPHQAEEERHYEQVIALVRDLLGDRAEEAAAIVHRLEEDYLQHQDGPPGAPGRPGGADRAGPLKAECEAEALKQRPPTPGPKARRDRPGSRSSRTAP